MGSRGRVRGEVLREVRSGPQSGQTKPASAVGTRTLVKCTSQPVSFRSHWQRSVRLLQQAHHNVGAEVIEARSMAGLRRVISVPMSMDEAARLEERQGPPEDAVCGQALQLEQAFTPRRELCEERIHVSGRRLVDLGEETVGAARIWQEFAA